MAIYLQSKLGSRFFVPAYFLPAKYNYFLKIQLQNLGKEVILFQEKILTSKKGTMFNLYGSFSP